MTMIVTIKENIQYYNEKYNKKNIKKILNQATIFIFESVAQNMKTMENCIGSETTNKMQKKMSVFLHEKLLLLTEDNNMPDNLKMKRTDIIKFNFDDKNIIDDEYKKLSRIDKNDMADYIDKKYGTIGECAFIFGWLLGTGDTNQKTLESISKIGASLGILIKLTYDFCNLENNIKQSDKFSYNFIVNCGIHECFKLYDENKINFLEGCMLNELYSSAIKEIIEKIDKSYDKCLKNTDIDLQSQYSSFVSK
jgi:hypothetical protein